MKRIIRRNILGVVGIAPVRASLVGGAADMPPQGAERWLGRMRRLGAGAS